MIEVVQFINAVTEHRRHTTCKQSLGGRPVIDRVAKQGNPMGTSIFKHVVTQEVAYESLPFATRARLHGQIGRYLETVFAGELAQQLDLKLGDARDPSQLFSFSKRVAEDEASAYPAEALRALEQEAPLSLAEKLRLAARRSQN